MPTYRIIIEGTNEYVLTLTAESATAAAEKVRDVFLRNLEETD
jgi:hypothetical protein